MLAEADFWTVSGWILTVAFGMLSAIQFLRDLKRNAAWDERAKHLVAAKNGLVQLRVMLIEAEKTQEVIRTDGARQFLRSLGHNIKSIEYHVDGMLPDNAIAFVASSSDLPASPTPPPQL